MEIPLKFIFIHSHHSLSFSYLMKSAEQVNDFIFIAWVLTQLYFIAKKIKLFLLSFARSKVSWAAS